MVDPIARDRIALRTLFGLLAIGVVFVQILPFRIGDTRFPGPDVLTLLAFAWVLRRPDFVPAWLVGLVVLFTDVVFMRPMGLWAAIVLLGLEFLRARAHLSRDLPFLVEWVMVAAVMLFMTLGQALVLAVFLVNQPALGLTFLQFIVSVSCYPLVVALSRYAFGVRKMTPGEADAMGHRT